ncbi:MAG TPA: hypothetical protein VII66_12970, partial [Gemmatimonadaceae bacterium]
MTSRVSSIRLTASISAALAVTLTAANLHAQQNVPTPANRWWHDITVLADDSMHGRRTGSADYLKAAGYVADQFSTMGLQPGGTNGFFQTVHLAEATVVPEGSGIVLQRGGASDTLRIGSDATVQIKPSTAA